jgi:dTMP kinase
LALYFKVPIDVSVQRILSGRAQLKDYEAGMDLNLASDKITSFKIFQSRILDEYERITHEYGLTVIDASLSIGEQQHAMRTLLDQLFEGSGHRDHGRSHPLQPVQENVA